MDEPVMTVAELLEVLGRQNPTHEVYLLVDGVLDDLSDVRVDDGAGRVTFVGAFAE